MALVDETWRMTEEHRAEVARRLRASGDEAEAAIEAVEDACRQWAAVGEDLKAHRGPDPAALTEVRELSAALRSALAGLNRDTADHLWQRYMGARIKKKDAPVPTAGTGHVAYKDLPAVLLRLETAAAPHERRGRRRKDEARYLVGDLADIWERYRGERPEWKGPEGAGAFGLFADFVGTDVRGIEQKGVERAIRAALIARGTKKMTE